MGTRKRKCEDHLNMDLKEESKVKATSLGDLTSAKSVNRELVLRQAFKISYGILNNNRSSG